MHGTKSYIGRQKLINTCLVLSKTMIFDGSTVRAAIPAECMALRADDN